MLSSDERVGDLIGVFICISVIIGPMLFFVGLGKGYTEGKNEAVKNEVAEYYINENQEKDFRWLNCK